MQITTTSFQKRRTLQEYMIKEEGKKQPHKNPENKKPRQKAAH